VRSTLNHYFVCGFTFAFGVTTVSISIDILDSGITPFSFDATSPENRVHLGQSTPTTNLLDFPTNAKTNIFDPEMRFPSFGCGFCTEDSACICRDIVLRQVSVESMNAPGKTPLKMEDFEHRTPAKSNERIIPPASMLVSQVSVLDNLPAYQPPVPLPWSGLPKSRKRFPLLQQFQPSPNTLQPDCSGDPANCAACADDSFGKAFCEAVQHSADVIMPCLDCPCSIDATNSYNEASTTTEPLHPRPSEARLHTSKFNIQNGLETIPTNEAWRQLKSHPNVEFTDLALLADVVVRRSQCNGPQPLNVPPPDTFPPAQNLQGKQLDDETQQDHRNGGNHSQVHTNGSHSRQGLVPQRVLKECGRRRVQEVRTDALDAALGLLDAKFGRT
jgi:hypothetical protein